MRVNTDPKRYARVKRKSEKKSIIILALLICLFFLGNIKLQDFKGQNDSLQNAEIMSGSLVISSPESIPDFAGADYVILNGNQPNFTQKDFNNISGEIYSKLDRLGRCGPAVAMLHRSMMPTGERGEIGQIKPSGWNQAKYEGYVNSNPPYLYNRCHLIAYALTGQNANERNLITGTRYMNVTAMLPFEKQVMSYLDDSDYHVLYRVTPYFKDKELVARGVEMEAYSVEDQGEGVCYHVFVYNYQPGIEIDYKTGKSQRGR